MKKIKSALEIAMQKADAISAEVTPEEKERSELEEKARHILSRFFRGTMDADELWQTLKKEENPLLINQVQEGFVDTLSLKSTLEDLKIRQGGILATESLKSQEMNFMVDRILNQMADLQKEYQEQMGDLNRQIQEELQKNPRMNMRPVRTPDGRTVMQATSEMDEERRRGFSSSYTEAENRYSQRFLDLKKCLQAELNQ